MLQEHSMQNHILDTMEDDHITTVIKCIAHYSLLFCLLFMLINLFLPFYSHHYGNALLPH